MSIEPLFFRARHKLLFRYRTRIAATGTFAAIAATAINVSSCSNGVCGPFDSQNTCDGKNFAAATAVKLSMAYSAREFNIEDGMIVTVIAKNTSDKMAIVADQKCNRPFYVYTDLGQPVGDLGLVCNGESYSGATLAPGDSVIWSGDIRNEIKNAGQDLFPGIYLIKGRMSVGIGVAWTRYDSITINHRTP